MIIVINNNNKSIIINNNYANTYKASTTADVALQ